MVNTKDVIFYWEEVDCFSVQLLPSNNVYSDIHIRKQRLQDVCFMHDILSQTSVKFDEQVHYSVYIWYSLKDLKSGHCMSIPRISLRKGVIHTHDRFLVKCPWEAQKGKSLHNTENDA